MQECFSRDPPVYAKPKNAVPPPTIRASSAEPQTNRPPPPRPPPPPSTSFQSTPTQQEPLRISTPPQAGSSNASPPPRPPKVYSTQIPATPPSTVRKYYGFLLLLIYFIDWAPNFSNAATDPPGFPIPKPASPAGTISTKSACPTSASASAPYSRTSTPPAFTQPQQFAWAPSNIQ